MDCNLTYLRPKLNHEVVRVLEEIMEREDQEVSRGVCRVLAQNVPGILRLQEYYLNEICGEASFESVTFAYFNCEPLYKSRVFKIVQPGDRIVNRDETPVPQFIIDALLVLGRRRCRENSEFLIRNVRTLYARSI